MPKRHLKCMVPQPVEIKAIMATTSNGVGVRKMGTTVRRRRISFVRSSSDSEDAGYSGPLTQVPGINYLDSIESFCEGSLFYSFLDLVFSVVAFLFVMLLMPFLLVVSFIFRIYRERLARIIHKENGDNIMLMKCNDAIWMQESSANKSVINSVMIIEGKPDIDVFRKLIAERLIHPKENDGDRLFSKVTMYTNRLLRRYVWVKESDFDINEHVYTYPEKVPNDKKELQNIVSKISSTPLPENKSPWQFVILEPEDEDAENFHVVFRVHHSVADGVSLVKALVYRMVDKIPEEVTKQRFGTSHRLKKIIAGIFYGPSLLIKRLGWPADQTILHREKLTGQKIVSWSETIDLDLIKELKNCTGTTVNDILVSCLAGALREFLQKHDTQLPTDISAYVPVDIRPPKSKLVLDNQFALVFLHLPVDTDSCLETLKKTRYRMNKIKNSPEALVNAMVVNYSMARLPDWFSTKIFDWFSRKCSMVLSNVPGPTQEISIGGQRITDIWFWPPQRSNVGECSFMKILPMAIGHFTMCNTIIQQS